MRRVEVIITGMGWSGVHILLTILSNSLTMISNVEFQGNTLVDFAPHLHTLVCVCVYEKCGL